MAQVGFELLIFSFGSDFDMETSNQTYVNEKAELISYANARGVEVALQALALGVHARGVVGRERAAAAAAAAVVVVVVVVVVDADRVAKVVAFAAAARRAPR